MLNYQRVIPNRFRKYVYLRGILWHPSPPTQPKKFGRSLKAVVEATFPPGETMVSRAITRKLRETSFRKLVL
jgi:hypothetical protein